MTTLLDAEDLWQWEMLFAPATKTVPFSVSALATVSDPARLTVWLQGGSDLPTSPDHHVRLFVNSTFVAETSWNAKRPRRLDADIPPGVLREGENVLEIENVGDTEASYSMVFLDKIELHYPRRLEGVDGTFEGTSRSPGMPWSPGWEAALSCST
jgi:hypothetical protein